MQAPKAHGPVGLFRSQLLQVSAFAHPLFLPLPPPPPPPPPPSPPPPSPPPSPPSKLVEANHPSVVPLQWLPVLLALTNAPPRSPPAPPCTDNGLGGTTGRGEWPPLPVDPSSVQCVNSSTKWAGWVLCHFKGVQNEGGNDEFYDRCNAIYKHNDCYPPGHSKKGCIRDAVFHCKSQYVGCRPPPTAPPSLPPWPSPPSLRAEHQERTR